MKTRLYRHEAGRGWNEPLDPDMDSGSTLVLVFSGLQDERLGEALETLDDAYPRAVIMGCSTAGEIFDDELSVDSIVCAVVRFDATRLRLAMRSMSDPGDSSGIGMAIARELDADDLKAVFILSEGLKVNGSRLIDGFNTVLHDNVVITGGLAADGDRFEHTSVIIRNGAQDMCVCAVGLYGDRLLVSHGSKGGWDRIGFEKKVTRSDGNVLYELDGQPALSVYRKYLGERADGLPSTGLLFPLALRPEKEDDETRVRTILGIDEQQQSIIFAGDIPQGSFVQLMHANFDRLIDGAAEAAASLEFGRMDGSEALCIAISCVGRRLILGERTEEEIESTLEHFPPGTRQIGYYSYGELSPLANGRCDLHNQTMTLTILREAAD